MNTRTWHRNAGFFLLIGTLIAAWGCNQTKSTGPKNFSVIELKPSSGQLIALLEAEAGKAKELHRKPFVEFYADWCGPCQTIKKNLRHPSMVDAFDGTYIIQLNVDAWGSQLASAGFPANTPIPVFFEINDEGKPTGRSITGAGPTPETTAAPLKRFFRG